jgi:hypothetical protein
LKGHWKDNSGKSIKHEVAYVSKELLHQRWGHSSENSAKDCEACVFGKSSVKSYDKHKDRTSTKELVHMDLIGPINGTYCAVLVWDFSDESAVIFLNRKSDFVEKWIKIDKNGKILGKSIWY